mgnify:CR=1 FL=1
MKYLILILVVSLFGCMSKQKAQKPIKKAFDIKVPCEGNEKCLNKKSKIFSNACNRQNSLNACYMYGKVREARGDDTIFVLQTYQTSCDRGHSKSCNEVRRLSIKKCIDNRISFENNRECYKMGPSEKISRGTSIISPKRVDSPSCKQKIEEAQKRCKAKK